MVAEIIFYATVALYAVASALFFAHLARSGGWDRAGKAAPRVLAGAAAFHAGYCPFPCGPRLAASLGCPPRGLPSADLVDRRES